MLSLLCGFAMEMHGAGQEFLVLRQGSLEVVTDGGEPRGRRALLQMRRMEQLLGRKRLPLRAYLFRDDKYFRDLRPSPTAHGFYQSAAERDYLAVVSSPEELRTLAHEFVHAAMEHTTARRPQWLEEGAAEFYSTVALEKGRWLVGRPVPTHVQLLGEADWLPAAEFLSVTKESSIYDEGNRVGIFYAQAWAVTHMLYSAPGYRERMPAFAALLDEGTAVEEALGRAFGRSGRQVMAEAQGYVRSRRFPVGALEAGESGEETVSVEAAGLPVVAELALAAGKAEFAARLYGREGSGTSLGLLALAQGDRAAALRHFDAAIRNGATEAAPYFEAAMLRREAGQPFEPLLRQTVARAPQHAEAWFLLGLEAARREEWEDAVEAYQHATEVLPRQAGFWHAMAMALVRSGRTAEARRAAVQCRLAAVNSAERQMAAALADLVSKGAAVPAQRKPAVVIPDSWQGPRADTTAEGVLEELTCGDPAVLRVSGTGELRVLRPRAVQITGGAATLECGPQQRKVRVGFIGATREVVSIEFLR